MFESSIHRAVEPLWMCAADGLPWPCEPARELLREVHTGDLDRLLRHMTQVMAVAEQDIGVLDRAALYRRFVVWALDEGQRCAMCGSPRHAAIPDVPPRLVPCNEVRGVVAGDVRAVSVDR